jgi:hypothetical protein
MRMRMTLVLIGLIAAFVLAGGKSMSAEGQKSLTAGDEPHAQDTEAGIDRRNRRQNDD